MSNILDKFLEENDREEGRSPKSKQNNEHKRKINKNSRTRPKRSGKPAVWDT